MHKLKCWHYLRRDETIEVGAETREGNVEVSMIKVYYIHV